MSAHTDVVANGLDGQPCLSDKAGEVIGVIHLAIAVCHRREVEACHCQAERCRCILLSVPQGFHDIQTIAIVQYGGGTTKDIRYFLFTEAIKELAHPYGIIAPVGGESRLRVQQIHPMSVDAGLARMPCTFGAHHLQLLRQIANRHFRIRHTFRHKACELACVAAYIQYLPAVAGKKYLQGFGKGRGPGSCAIGSGKE